LVNEILIPSFQIRTAEDLMRWHDDLIEIALRCEFEKKIIEATLKNISNFKKGATEEKELVDAAMLELKILTELQMEYRKSLGVCKNLLKMIYFTNEVISTSIIEKNQFKKFKENELSKHKTPLLHGIGWRFEYYVMNKLREKGYASFLTYGGLLEPHGVDIIAFKPKNAKIELNLEGYERIGLEKILLPSK